MIRSVITGSGHYLPEKIVKNEDFINKEFYLEDNTRNETATDIVIQKFKDITEIKERRYLLDGLYNSDMAAKAGLQAIEEAGINKEELDYVIVCHNYGDIDEKNYVDLMPSISSRVKNKLGIKNNKCRPYDMIFGCPGWVEGTILADQLIKGGIAKKILVIGSETLSRGVDPHDRNSMIFADGAGAIVLEKIETDENIGIINSYTIADNLDEISYIKNSPSLNLDYDGSTAFISMKGRKVYEYALKKVPALIKKVIDDAKMNINDVNMVLLHQANAKMDHAMVQRLYKLYNIPIEEIPANVAPMTVQFLGNTSVATIPTMYDMVRKNQIEGYEIKPGDVVVFASVGASMNINAILYKHP